jgi:hypothetical protein
VKLSSPQGGAYGVLLLKGKPYGVFLRQPENWLKLELYQSVVPPLPHKVFFKKNRKKALVKSAFINTGKKLALKK